MLSGGPTTSTELAKMSVMPRPQVTHVVDQLVKAGIVERKPDPRDRRMISIILTPHGNTVLNDLKLKMHESIRKQLSDLAPEDLAEMAQALDTLRRVSAKLR